MKTIHIAICVAVCLGRNVLGQDQQSVKAGIETTGVAGLTVYQTALARPDLAVAKSLINERLLKGEIGEAIRDQTVGRYLHQSGKWQNVSPRLGRQGIDHISMQFDNDGRPIGSPLVEETKFGSSQLGNTKDGVQLGTRWTNKRLQAYANLCRKIANEIRSGQMRMARQPQGLSSRHFIPVPLQGDKKATVWRPDSKSGWFIDCPPEYVSQMPQKLDLMAKVSEKSPIKLLNQVEFEGNLLKVTVRDAGAVDEVGGNLNMLPVKARLEIPVERTVWASDTIVTKMAEELRKQMPYLDSAEARQQAKDVLSNSKTAEEALVRRSFGRFALAQSGKAGVAGVLVAVPLEIAAQLIETGQVDWQHVAGVGVLAGGSAAIGSTLGNATTLLLRTEAGYSASSAVAELVGLKFSAGRFANGAGGLVGGGATAILFAYGGYWLGYYDLKTANRAAVAGSAGIAAGRAFVFFCTSESASEAAAEGGVLAVEAETGAELSELGPVEWIAVGITMAVTAPIMYGFHAYDEQEDNIRLSKTIEYLFSKPTFSFQAHNIEAPHP